MKTLNQAYQGIHNRLTTTNSSYRAQNLKRHLKEHWENISIFSQKGLSDIVNHVCSTMTVRDVLSKIISSVEERGRKSSRIGSSWEDLNINRRTGKTATMFIASLYGRLGCASLNNLTAEKAASSINIASKTLPPTEDALHLHIQRIVSAHHLEKSNDWHARPSRSNTAWFWENWNHVKTQDDEPDSSCSWAHEWTIVQMSQQQVLCKLLLLGKPANVHTSLCLFRWQYKAACHNFYTLEPKTFINSD